MLKCHNDGQSLKFAYLDHPTCRDQPRYPWNFAIPVLDLLVCHLRFLCKYTDKHYYVGFAQKVELDWIQDVLGLVVKPISLADTLSGAFASKVMQAAEKLICTLKREPSEGSGV